MTAATDTGETPLYAQPPPSEEAALAFNKANAAFRAGNWTAALDGCERALVISQDFVLAHILKARALSNLSRLPEAAACYESALRLDSENFTAWLERGNIYRRMDMPEKALACYQRAAAARPLDRRAHIALARIFETPGKTADVDRAAVHYHKAVASAGAGWEVLADTHHRIGLYRLEAGNNAGALEAFRSAQHALGSGARDKRAEMVLAMEIECSLAEALLKLGLTDEAMAAMQAASLTENEAILRRLADIAYRFNFWQEALQLLERNALLRPDSGAAELAVADIASKSWQLELAQQALVRAEAKGGVTALAISTVSGAIAGRLGNPDAAIAHYQDLLAAGDEAIKSSIAMSSLYSDTKSVDEVATLHRSLFADWGENARIPSSFANPLVADRPLRVGMVSRDLHRQHPVNIFLQPMLAEWDQQCFPLTIYFTGNTRDDQTARAQRFVSKRSGGQWREVHPDKLASLPGMVERDAIDILIDLAGHTSAAQMQLFAQRMAPVQASYLGYPGSTGVPNIDWLFGDDIVTPPEHDRLYSERVARLPGTVFCFAPLDTYPEPEWPGSLGDRPLTFGSFNNIPKLTARTIGLWAAILREMPDSRLLLKAASFQDRGAIERYRGLFEAEGIAADRLLFRGPSGLADMMQEYGEIDIALDPVPYNGGTTTLQAMWMGAPVVTMLGQHFVSRMGASFMTAGGLADWVAVCDSDYVKIAVGKASDRAALAVLKRSLRSTLESRSAWDIKRFTLNFQNHLAEIWRNHVQAMSTAD